MKKQITIYIFIIIFLLAPFALYAETASFNSTSIDVDAGSNFDLSVDVTGLQNATTIEAILEYDPTILTFISVEADDNSVMAPLFELGIIFATSTFGALERMSVSVPSASPTNGDGELIKAVFKLSDDAIGNASIALYSLTEYKDDFSSVSATLGSDLAITVTNPVVIEPLRTNASPSGTLSYGTTQTTISLITDVNATCRYSTSADIPFDSQTIFANTGATTHSQSISGLSSGNSYNYYVKCQNQLGVGNTSDYLISFVIDLPPVIIPPSGGGGGGGGGTVVVDKTPPGQITELMLSEEADGIKLDWTNPNDSDFSKVSIFRLGKILDDNEDIANIKANSLISYETSDEFYVDNSATDYKNYYIIFTEDNSANFSSPIITKSIMEELIIASTTHTETEEVTEIIEPETIPPSTTENISITSLYGVASNIVEKVSKQEADKVIENKQFVNLSPETLKIYQKVVAGKNITDSNIKYQIAYFIHYGTPTTQSLGAGERGGVLDSYYSAFSKMPTLDYEWMDIIKIANGRWPTERNSKLEEESQNNIFNTIYKRIANMNLPTDNAAVTVITYGLRPAHRNMDSERTGIKFFKGIFGHNPENATDWDIVRAIAYSGAVR